MKLDKFAAAIGGQPGAADAEAARQQQALHQEWLTKVYPFWQGAMSTFSRTKGVTCCVHMIEPGFPAAANAGEVRTDLAASEGRPIAWRVAETIQVETSVGIVAAVSYVLAGDENDCVMARVASVTDRVRTIVTVGATARTWAGTLAKIVEAAIADVGEAAELFDDLLLAGVELRQRRVDDEAKAAKAEEARRLEEIELSERRAADEKLRQEEAALAESRRREAAAKVDAVVVPQPSAPSKKKSSK